MQVAAFVSYGFIVAAYGNWWLISLAGYSMLPLTIFLSFGNTVNVVPWYYASALGMRRVRVRGSAYTIQHVYILHMHVLSYGTYVVILHLYSCMPCHTHTHTHTHTHAHTNPPLVLLSALEPLDNIFLQTIATVLACILGNNLWLPILLITKAPGMANPAWLEVLGLLQQHMKLVKGMVCVCLWMGGWVGGWVRVCKTCAMNNSNCTMHAL